MKQRKYKATCGGSKYYSKFSNYMIKKIVQKYEIKQIVFTTDNTLFRKPNTFYNYM